MQAAARMSGVLCPVVTPFREDLSPDTQMLSAQCQWLLSQGVGLAVFGTNSEANSMSAGEKTELLCALVDNGIDVRRMMPGTGGCALPDTVALTRTAVMLNCAGVLMLPPFYYKTVSEDGLFAYFSEVIQRVADRRLKVYLYHIPPVAQVGVSPSLIERLIKTYPDTIAGIKDSSGDWSYARSLLNREWDDFRVFVGSDTLLLQNMRAGGAGCISATANINPAAIHSLYQHWQADDAADAQQSLTNLRTIVQQQPMIPALKSIVAHFSNNAEWRRVRPPLTELTAAQQQSLIQALQQTAFDMPGLAAV